MNNIIYKDQLIKQICYYFSDNSPHQDELWELFKTKFKNYNFCIFPNDKLCIIYSFHLSKRYFRKIKINYDLKSIWTPLYRFLELESDINMLEQIVFEIL